MNTHIEKVLLLVGLDKYDDFYVQCKCLLETAEKAPEQFTGAELVLVQMVLRTLFLQVQAIINQKNTPPPELPPNVISLSSHPRFRAAKKRVA